jgi:hypothetical protein
MPFLHPGKDLSVAGQVSGRLPFRPLKQPRRPLFGVLTAADCRDDADGRAEQQQ